MSSDWLPSHPRKRLTNEPPQARVEGVLCQVVFNRWNFPKDMKQAQQQVREFMMKAGQECPDKPTKPPFKIHNLRVDLIEEELGELWQADTVEECADAIGDLLYVVIGTAVACGIDIEPVFNEIHRSNMSKFIDGHRREDGKWIKGPSYSPANLKPFLNL